MENIELFKKDGMWVAKTDNPKVKELFGTDTLPTPFMDSVDGMQVARVIEARNPHGVTIVRVEQ